MIFWIKYYTRLKTGIEKFDDTKTLINADGRLPDNITLTNVLILITSVMKDDGKFYPQLFWDRTLYDE